MADRERWKPIAFVFMFSIGFFVFSKAPFVASLVYGMV
jgi:hypothetical protein